MGVASSWKKLVTGAEFLEQSIVPCCFWYLLCFLVYEDVRPCSFIHTLAAMDAVASYYIFLVVMSCAL